MSIIVIFWLILVEYGKNWPILVKYGQSKVFLVHFICLLVHLGVFLEKCWLIICQFLSNFGKFFPKKIKKFLSSQLFLNIYWKSNVEAIIYSINIGSQMSRQLLSQLLLEVV